MGYIFSLLLSSFFTFVELNCENMFDTLHDSLKSDQEFLPESRHHWTRTRYWSKLNKISKEIIALGENGSTWQLPSLVVLCEVENDTVMRDLTQRSLLRNANYRYFITHSPDQRGIDVALLYDPFIFRPLSHYSLRVPKLENMRPTRDILYVNGIVGSNDTIHIFAIHSPSRAGGERSSRPYRLQVARRLALSVDSIYAENESAQIIIAGDFNDYTNSPAMDSIYIHRLRDISSNAIGANGVKGTYRYHGVWGSLDHILCSLSMLDKVDTCYIGGMDFLLEEDTRYGGVHPKRNYQGPIYKDGYSDHLPLVARIRYD